MEGNKDEAVRCLEIARKFYSEGNLPQAIKFAKKSINLYPTDAARDLLTTYENNSSEASQSSSNSSSKSQSQSHSHNTSSNHTSSTKSSSGNSGSPGSAQTSPATERAYTQEQLEAVQRVRRLKDYYEILEITKDAKEPDIKKAYRKLALLMHPDKNSAPGSEDAFKAVSKAFACLSDPVARKQYDLHGPDVPQVSHSHRHNAHYSYETELTPEQIFEMMFGIGRPNANFRTYTYRSGGGGHRRQQQSSEPESIGALLMQFLPLLMLGLIIFFFSSGPEEPAFSLAKMNPYYYPKETHHWGIKYWVKQDTYDKLSRGAINVDSLENEVERQWKVETERKCSYEHQQKQRMERAAYYASGQEKEVLREKISRYEMPHCEELRRVTSVK